MSSATNTLVRRLVVSATLAGIVAGIAFLLVARGGATPQPATNVRPWHKLPAAPVRFDQPPASVWTGSKLILLGRRSVTAVDSRGAPYVVKSFDAAEAYDPASGGWTRLSPPAGPAYVPGYNAVWDGKEMLAFGAFHSVAYNPATNTWRTLPKSVGGGLVVWTGHEAIGWGGGCCGDAWGNGLAYNPATDRYRELAPSPLAPSQRPIGAWTGHELVLFSSGRNPAGDKPYAGLARAAAYDPAKDTWRRITALPASALGFGGAAAWDGHEVLIAGYGAGARAALAYDPATNERRALARMPFGLRVARAFWTGDRLVVWGGSETARGLAYDPRGNRWSELPAAPLSGFPAALGWTGHSLIVGAGAHAAAFTPPR